MEELDKIIANSDEVDLSDYFNQLNNVEKRTVDADMLERLTTLKKQVYSIKYYEEAGKVGKVEEAWDAILKKGRDNARTPMQWSGADYAGFSTVEPWLMVNENYKKINVAAAEEDENSILRFYQKLIRFKSSDEVAVYGNFEELLEEDEQLYVYKRTLEDKAFLVICNFSDKDKAFDMIEYQDKEMLFHNCENDSNTYLIPYEARVIKLT